MNLNYFKDLLFDVINESDKLSVVDIISNDKESTFIIELWTGKFLLKCSEYNEAENKKGLTK